MSMFKPYVKSQQMCVSLYPLNRTLIPKHLSMFNLDGVHIGKVSR